ncbi:putative lipoprotein [Russula earlei]|uniref:Lipoprotein n=1 Tax=Russula earlei TaxID=71964 RepID=A0ACC0TVN2_9AGAM|nr:putative lipoprotein [Russula earlei]
MKKTALCSFLCVIAMACLLACGSQGTGVSASITTDSLVKKGKYLVNTMGCNDCHSPKVMTAMGPVPDTSRLLSGHPSNIPLAKIDTAVVKQWVLLNPMLTNAAGPWGVSFAANLTPDESGIGNWTEEQFSRAMKGGKSKGMQNGRDLLPPMPRFMQVKDEDVKAIFTYLKSIKPIYNVVPAAIPPGELGKK